MANVAATIARDGVWLRPKLLAENKPTGERQERPPTTQAADRTDLGLSAAAMKAAREGMFKVVNSKAGSGTALQRTDLAVAGKTGSAQASPFRIPVKDPATGKQAKNEKGELRWVYPQPANHLRPNAQFPWYRGSGREGNDLTHAWFIGYAPAEDPQVAFAVLVEYGGSGGGAAASVASGLLDLCVAHKYLTPPVGPVSAAPDEAAATQPTTSFASPATQTWRELLTDLPATQPGKNPTASTRRAP
jgi:cell division protein FtsI/penicillin-binding protein 2